MLRTASLESIGMVLHEKIGIEVNEIIIAGHSERIYTLTVQVYGYNAVFVLTSVVASLYRQFSLYLFSQRETMK